LLFILFLFISNFKKNKTNIFVLSVLCRCGAFRWSFPSAWPVFTASLTPAI